MLKRYTSLTYLHAWLIFSSKACRLLLNFGYQSTFHVDLPTKFCAKILYNKYLFIPFTPMIYGYTKFIRLFIDKQDVK